MGMLERIKDVQKRNEEQAAKSSGGSISYMSWKDGDQVVRFCGEWIETRIVWLTKNNYNPTELFDASAFEGDDRIPKILNTPNWDIATETEKDGGCVIAKLNEIARKILKESDIDTETKEKFTALRDKTNYSTNYKWLVLDRANPKNDKGDLTYKIATVGKGLFKSLASFADDYDPMDFTSDKNGVDMKVSKTKGSSRVEYSAGACLKGASVLVSPLTADELAIERPDLNVVCGKQTDQDLLRSKLLPEWQDLLSLYEKDNASTDSDDSGDGPGDEPF